MLIRRITTSTTINGESKIRCAEIGGGDDDRGPRNTIPEVVDTSDLETGAADLTFLKEGGAQPRRSLAVAGLLEIAVPARASDGVTWVRRRVVRGPRRLPFR